jgi:ABC-2 type transport system ATP-binding protein
MTHPSLAALSNVTKRFGAVVALDNLSLEIARGELLAVLGPNGAGKSTAIGLLLGLHQPASGAVRLFDRAPDALAARQRIGVMMQDVSLVPDLKVKEHVHLASSYYPAPMPVAEAMALTRVAALANRTYATLSGGQKKLVQFAVAVCGRPELLFLDEPTAGLDVESRALVWETMRRLRGNGTAIVLTTHYLEEAEALADRVAVLVKGRLVADGTVDEIRAVVDRKRVICTTRLAPEDLERWPGVEAVACRDRRVHLTVRNAEQTVRRLLTADEDVRDLEVLRAGLTEAFTELTQEVAR